MKTPDPIERLTSGGAFSFRRLDISGIDNDPVFRVNDPKMVREETCLFHRDVPSGNDYVKRLGDRVAAPSHAASLCPCTIRRREYALYHFELAATALQLADRNRHHKGPPCMRRLLTRLARRFPSPLVYHGNIEDPPSWMALFKHWPPAALASTFLRYLKRRGSPDGEELHPLLRRLRPTSLRQPLPACWDRPYAGQSQTPTATGAAAHVGSSGTESGRRSNLVGHPEQL